MSAGPDLAVRALDQARRALVSAGDPRGHWTPGTAAPPAWTEPDPAAAPAIAPESVFFAGRLRKLPPWARVAAVRGAAHSGAGIALPWIRARALAKCNEWLAAHPLDSPALYDTAVAVRALAASSNWLHSHMTPRWDSRVDAIALALTAEPGKNQAAIDWLSSHQSPEGWWSAWGAGLDAALDPPCPATTGRALEALAANQQPPNRAAIDWLVRTQELDGAWIAAWGGGPVHGTFQALRGLRAAGEHPREAHMLRGGEWLRGVQNPDGSWGSPGSAVHTAWAVLGLLASGDDDSMSLDGGVDWLARGGHGGAYTVMALETWLRDRNRTRGDLA